MSEPKRITLCLDFDGVIHKYSRGWQDGSIYDEPVYEAPEYLPRLAQRYRLVILTARFKVKEQHFQEDEIWAWLQKWDLAQYIADVTRVKPPEAIAFVDDRAIRFLNWPQAFEDIEFHYANEEYEKWMKSFEGWEPEDVKICFNCGHKESTHAEGGCEVLDPLCPCLKFALRFEDAKP
jgi:hypothetical protein